MSESSEQQQTCSHASLPPSAKKRKRTARASNGQVEALIAKLEAAPSLATRRFTGFHGRESFELGWKVVSEEINSLPGAEKSPEQWMTFWRDLKSKASSKAAKLNRERIQTGNQPTLLPPLTEIEKRVLSIIGTEYAVGTDCPDSMPEEGEVLEIIEENDAEMIINITENVHIQSDQQTNEGSTDGAPAQAAVPLQPAPLQPTPLHHRRHANLNPRRSVMQQHNEARRDFLAVAQANAESMKVLAEAAKLNAEAAKTQAEASLLLAQGLNKIGDALKAFVDRQ